VKLYDHTPITYLLSTTLASCFLKNGFRRFVPHIIGYVTITNSQRKKKRMFIVIHFNPSRLFFCVCTIEQGWANRCPRATCDPPQCFQWPSEAFRTIVKSEISFNQCRIDDSSKCSNCYGPALLGVRGLL